jgi:hypothetical protein
MSVRNSGADLQSVLLDGRDELHSRRLAATAHGSPRPGQMARSALPAAARSELGALFAPPQRRPRGQGGFLVLMGQLPPEPVDYTPAEPSLVVEVGSGPVLGAGPVAVSHEFRRTRLDPCVRHQR